MSSSNQFKVPNKSHKNGNRMDSMVQCADASTLRSAEYGVFLVCCSAFWHHLYGTPRVLSGNFDLFHKLSVHSIDIMNKIIVIHFVRSLF